MVTVALAGCGSEQRLENQTAADITAAAEAAQGDIDTYAANALQPSPLMSSVTVAPTSRAVPVPQSSVAADQDHASIDDDAGPEVVAEANTAVRTIGYRCAGETLISVRFDDTAGTATIEDPDRGLAILAGQRPAAGIWYKGGGYELRGTGRDADYAAPGRRPIACIAE